ncbi:type I-E CRISPR-associated protein Cse2/CasB [Glycomyces sp. NRRL B-16210]|uniref:type I-E CRISPR-associated protein Cse2/CasB n=1 Tax=Glycomyces sp. NRRL B-16210 TaxID=1463821 RepID=UPI0004BFC9EA|nr:type I-E CRISPR-associated protein Cse2/CasB [Glycomyces sp. NRRL B-16210]
MAALTQDTKRSNGELIPAVLKQPGPRATLKRCLGQRPDSPAWDHAWGHLIDYLPEQAVPDDCFSGSAVADEQRAFVTVAAMICAQPPTARAKDLEIGPDGNRARNLGSALAVGVGERNISNQDAGLHRLILLSRQNVDGIHRLLPRTVQHLRGALVPLDWVRLITDLADWRRRRRSIAKWWIQDYHRNLNRIKAAKLSNDPNAESETT